MSTIAKIVEDVELKCKEIAEVSLMDGLQQIYSKKVRKFRGNHVISLGDAYCMVHDANACPEFEVPAHVDFIRIVD
jgi:hypothetical protein